MSFVDESTTRGLGTPDGRASLAGASVADFDGDGDLDIFVGSEPFPGTSGADRLFRNRGDGTFDEVAADLGVASTVSTRAALWLDYDTDHDLDLLTAGACISVPSCPPGQSLFRLFRQNDDGTFEDVTSRSGLEVPAVLHVDLIIGGLAAGDLDNDGRLDLVATTWGGKVFLFFNQSKPGETRFQDVSRTSGLGGGIAEHYQPILHDFDGDGWLDIFIATDFVFRPIANQLWINQGDGTFVDQASVYGVDTLSNQMGVTLGDYDNDGDFDLFVTNIFFDFGGFVQTNSLFRRDGNVFTDVAVDAGVADTGFGWGTTFFDADRDGWLDLAAVNGFITPPWLDDRSSFFLHNGDNPVTFADRSAAVGFDDPFVSFGLAAFDADRDGDLDLIQTTGNRRVLLRMNEPDPVAAGHHYLVVQPRMAGGNHFAIGAVVTTVAGGVTRSRLITAGTSFQSQEPAEAFFGLGDATQVDQVTVRWPDGRQTVVHDVAVDQVVEIGDSGALTVR